MAEAIDLWKFHPAGQGTPGPLGGALTASGAPLTVAPTKLIHHIVGAPAIVNITPPAPDFNGCVIFIADGIFTWTAAGNIAVLGTTTAALKMVMFVYDPTTAKWYPSSVA